MSFSIFNIHSNFLEADLFELNIQLYIMQEWLCPDFSYLSCKNESCAKMVKIILKNDMEGLALLNVMTF